MNEKSKKLIIKLLIIDVFIMLVVFIGINYYVVSSVEKYAPRRYDQIFQNKELLEHYGIGDKRSPKDYGLPYEDVTFLSEKDNLKLHAWYMPGQKKSDEVIFLVHGRQSTRYKPMKYLELLKKWNIDAQSAIFLPDFRNSGVSPDARTAMGYRFAEDIFYAVKFLHKKYGKKRFTFYSFSMGAMATLVFLNREDFRQELKQMNFQIDKIILDSPMVNVTKNLYAAAERDKLPSFPISMSLPVLSYRWDGYLSKMRLSLLAKHVNVPILILQGAKDIYTPDQILREELQALGEKNNLKVHYFADAEHVVIWRNQKYTSAYEKIVHDFFFKK